MSGDETAHTSLDLPPKAGATSDGEKDLGLLRGDIDTIEHGRPIDFGFLPIPRRLQYDPEHPAHFGLVLNVVFGLASTFIVANLYYCQPLLIQFSKSFGVSYDEISRIPTLVQAGYGTGLLLITPLGDLVRRRPLLLLVTFTSASLSICLAVTRSLAVFEAFSFLVGVSSVAPQILIPLAADLAPPSRRASAISIVLSGLLFGVLIARVVAGVIAQFTSWRVVYYMAIGVQYSVLLALWATLPDYPAKNKDLTYWRILWTMGKLAVTEPKLIQACLITTTSSACFTTFWVTLTFLLGGQYHYSTLVIGLFGLIGMVGVMMAPLVGRFVDQLVPWHATLLATCGLLLIQAVYTGAAGVSIGAVVVTTIGLDIGRQLQQVSLTTSVYSISQAARARLNAVLILFIFIGQVMGTAVGTKLFVQHGWRASAILMLSWTVWQLFVLLLRGPHCERYTWFGYQGGLEWRKRALTESEAEKAGSEGVKDALEGGADVGNDPSTTARAAHGPPLTPDVRGTDDADKEKQGRFTRKV
ncbi:MFS general substrate transporter [Artomyces pyxidatus]|uniref:MFS general substrate transporter n=1 Tax=Artomyces pyxidatus TaxID=48021 RepID=A0ACB8SJN5_9AGAM|nr:MFS general substrate transporter [Artomyces pyxidatus]